MVNQSPAVQCDFLHYIVISRTFIPQGIGGMEHSQHGLSTAVILHCQDLTGLACVPTTEGNQEEPE